MVRFVLASLRWVLRFIPVARHRIAVLDGIRLIEALEASNRNQEARETRATLLASTPPKCSAPLWRSEGDDLFRAKDYRAALAAFQQAAVALDQSAALYGVARADAIFYGAAASALMLGDLKRAREYQNKLEELFRQFRSMPSMAAYIAEWTDRLTWLNDNLDPEGDNGDPLRGPPGAGKQ